MRAPLVAALLMLAGCGAAQTPGASVPPAIEVDQVGTEPWSVVRFSLAPGLEQRFELTIKVRAATTFTNTVLEDDKRDLDFPGLVLRMRARVTALTSGGDAHLAYEVEDARVLDDVIDSSLHVIAEREATALRGMRSTARLSPNGALSELKLDNPSSSQSSQRWQNEIEAALHTSDVVFPDAPIGVGAMWRVTSRPVMRGVQWTRTATYSLRARSETTIDLDATIEMSAGSQALRTEPNASIRLTGAQSKTSVHGSVALTKIVGDISSETTGELSYLIVRRHERLSSTTRLQSITSTKPLGDAVTR